MGLKDKDVGIFTRLGLTNRQAEVYLTIFKLGQTTVGACAKTMQIARAEIYRAISTLEKIGLVKRVIASPTIFRAIPIADGLSIPEKGFADIRRRKTADTQNTFSETSSTTEKNQAKKTINTP